MAERKTRILDCISSPADLHVLSIDELNILASEIRSEIIETASNNGGHVASSLGAVEMILAAHSIINSPKDKLVFDVGHQSYAHKLVTGRAQDFPTLRTYGGLSGFPKPSESVHDVHPSGHASDSLSVASGLAKAKLLNHSDEKIIAIIGDAALAGGMAFEALNYIGSQQLPLVIMLNDNEMSISKNVGALMRHLGNIRATQSYRNAREFIQERLEQGGRMSNAFAEIGKRIKDSTKHMFIPQSMIYEQLGIVCTPPIDGHDIAAIREMLELVLQMDAPVLMHLVTKKGVGYGPAVLDPERFHGIGPFNIETSEELPKEVHGPKYTDVFGSVLTEEAATDESIVAITAAMEGGTGLKQFHAAYPDRFIDVGISEEQAVGMASGLAVAGKKPVVAIYSTFLQRAIDQVIIDVALPDLGVVFALDRAGLVGDDGPTHHGVFDIAYLRMIPNMKILVPSNARKLADSIHTALTLSGPVAIRYPRGNACMPWDGGKQTLEVGRAEVVREGSDVAILAWGRMVEIALEAAKILSASSIDAMVVDMIWAKPLDTVMLDQVADKKLVLTLEEGSQKGGAGEEVLEYYAQTERAVATEVVGIPDEFISQGPVNMLFDDAGMSASCIAERIMNRLAATGSAARG